LVAGAQGSDGAIAAADVVCDNQGSTPKIRFI